MGKSFVVLVGVDAHGIFRKRNAGLERCHLLPDAIFLWTISYGALDGIAALEVVIEYRVVEGQTNKVRSLRDAVHRGDARGRDRCQRSRGPLRQVLRYHRKQAL